MNLNSPRLKRPFILQILAILFMLAPLGNIFISFYGTGRSDWFATPVFLSWLGNIQSLDWFWLSLTFATGILLFVQHKTAWLLSIVSLLVILTVNIYRWLTTGDLIDVEYSYFQNQMALSTLGTLLALGVIFYARYPYLDRRTGWVGSPQPRYEMATPVIVVAHDVFNGTTLNISNSGALIQMSLPNLIISNMKFIDLIFPEIDNLKIKSQVIQSTPGKLRLKFRELKANDKEQLKNHLDRRA